MEQAVYTGGAAAESPQKKALSVYIHIPFCVRKCLYCDFLSAPGKEGQQEQYVKALCREIREESKSYVNHKIQTIFIGGGTPSLLSGEQLTGILAALRDAYEIAKDCEISMEVNPGTATREKLSAYYRAGVNRLSIGLQSAREEELKALGRIHSYRDFLDTWEYACACGFKNLNVDLMFGIPRQTKESWQDTLQRVTALEIPPVHISAYGLSIEEGTPFYTNTPPLPDEEEERLLYKITGDFLESRGYHRYEISNYAREGWECRHNCVYWRRGDYVGFGLGAASMVGNVRFRNTRDIDCYVNRFLKQQNVSIREEVQLLSKKEQMEEFMFLGLRLMEGVSSRQFRKEFGIRMEEVYPEIAEKFCNMGLLTLQETKEGDTRIALTKRGIDVSNVVMAEFLLT